MGFLQVSCYPNNLTSYSENEGTGTILYFLKTGVASSLKLLMYTLVCLLSVKAVGMDLRRQVEQ